MKFNHVRLHSTGFVEPPEYLTSTDIETKLAPLYERAKLPEGRLELQTQLLKVKGKTVPYETVVLKIFEEIEIVNENEPVVVRVVEKLS